jgi:hypothetical protein
MAEFKLAVEGSEMSARGDDAEVRRGGCLCGAVRFDLVGPPARFGLCHCADCRKESGSVFTAYARWPRSRFAFAGRVETFRGRSFCPVCGSRLFNLTEQHVELRIGSLDAAPSGLGVPAEEGWIRRREPWLEPVPGAAEFEGDVAAPIKAEADAPERRAR